ncbi:hypothetical protein BH10PLA2_BH10PLA2_20180 [soil metagenome]
MFQAEEIRKLLAMAGQPLKAMILLGINCGYGNSDVGTLPLSTVDLEGGWLNYGRPKTGISRRCPLWPETAQAIKEWLTIRPKPKDESSTSLLFLTSQGHSWSKNVADSTIT